MTRLTDFALDIYSQFGDDGIIAHIFSVIGDGDKSCVEFGAGDGESCSQTAHLWADQEWTAVLVEADKDRFNRLQSRAARYQAVCINAMLTPDGPGSISAILRDRPIDFMSIDIDGDDYFHVKGLTVRPRVLCVEFNPTIPPHLNVRQASPGGTFGQSLESLILLLAWKGYRFIGSSYANAFFVVDEEAGAFDKYDTTPEPRDYTYAVTDYYGRIVLVGAPLPWGVKEPYVRPLTGVDSFPPTSNKQEIRRGFEALWGEAIWVSVDGLSEARLNEVLDQGGVLFCIDLWNSNLEAAKWMWAVASERGYVPILCVRVLGLVREDAM